MQKMRPGGGQEKVAAQTRCIKMKIDGPVISRKPCHSREGVKALVV
jgi:hypothetical protein